MNGRNHACLSQLLVERYILDEVGEAERTRVEEAVAQCDSCRSTVDGTAAEEKAFGLRPVPARIRKLWLDSHKSFSTRRALLAAAPIAAGVAIAVFFVFRQHSGATNGEYVPAFDQQARAERTRTMGGEQPSGSSSDQVSVEKNDLRFGFYLLADGKEQMGRDGQKLQEGDRIQFWYEAPGDGWAVIVGIDGRGEVTKYFPSELIPDGRIRGGRGHLIASSVILDDAKGVERYFFCYDRGGRSPEEVVEAARRAAGRQGDVGRMIRLPVDCAQASTWIEKE